MSIRRSIGVIAASICVLALTACGSSSSSESSSAAAATAAATAESAAPSEAASDGSWSYTSGSGETITLDHKPERIIASAAEAAGLLAYGIKPVGIYLAQDLAQEPGLANADLSGIEIVGEEWGKIDAEKVAALEPDLIIADWWPPQQAYQGFEEGVDAASMKVPELAPVIGASQQGSLEEIVQWYEGFAKSLGKDVDTPELTADRDRFLAAKAAFQEAVAAKPGLSALAVGPSEDMLYVAVPEYSTSLTDFKNWGLDVIEPDAPKADFPYWEFLSWENADKYQPDLLLLDDRSYESGIETGEAQPTWNKIAAGKAKSYTPWPGFWVHTYGAYADQLETLTAAVQKADENIAS